MTAPYRVLRFCDNAWSDVPGLPPLEMSHQAIRQAMTLFEKSNCRTGVFSAEPRLIWDSAKDVPDPAPRLPFEMEDEP